MFKRFEKKYLIPLIEKVVQRELHSLALTTPVYETKDHASISYDEITRKLSVLEKKLEKKKKEANLVALQIQRLEADDPSTLDVVVENPQIQETLDAFDFKGAVEAAKKLDYTFGLEEKPYTLEVLVTDAIALLNRLEEDVKDGECGRLQSGRLVAIKMWSTEEKQPWYVLNFFIENMEA